MNNKGDNAIAQIYYQFIAALIIVLVIEARLLSHLSSVWKLWPPRDRTSSISPPLKLNPCAHAQYVTTPPTHTLSLSSGLVALRSEDVLELMMDDYPAKFAEYQEVMQERDFQATLHKKIMEAKRVAVMVCKCVCVCVCVCVFHFVFALCVCVCVYLLSCMFVCVTVQYDCCVCAYEMHLCV